MTIEYLEDKILEKEKWNGAPLIGYINPYGKILDFSTLKGEYMGHDSIINPATPIFLKYISYIVRVDNNENLKQFTKRGYESYKYYVSDEFLKQLQGDLSLKKENINFFINIGKRLNQIYEFDMLEYDLLKLFSKLYSNDNFFNSLGREIYADNMDSVWEKYKNMFKFKEYQELDEKYKYYFENYLVIQLMSYFKDVCVQYLGYDSIERAWPIGDLYKVNNLYSASNGYVFSPNLRIITTSARNVNERFYNWLLMYWEIQKIPKKVWNEDEKKFEDESYVFDYIYR